jgi:Na+/phosphate symporter
MMGGTKCLIALGRWVVVLTHVLECVISVLFVLMAAYSVTTGKGRLQLIEPWESILFCVFFTICSAILLCWGVFCLAFAVLLRRCGHAGSVKQIATILQVAFPF